jgi:hypothetical protein
VTTWRDEDPATGRPDDTQPTPREAPDDGLQPLPAAPGTTRAERRRAQEAAEAAAGHPFAEAFTESPSGTRWQRPTFDEPATGTDADGSGPRAAEAPADPASGLMPEPRGWREPPPGDPRRGDVRPGDVRPGGPRPGDARPGDARPGDARPGDLRAGDLRAGDLRAGAFDPGDTGTWRVRDVVPGADGGRRNTVILRYLLGLLAVDHVRSLTRWAFALPPVGLVLLLVKPRWIGLVVIVLGVLLVLGRFAATRLISRRTLPRRYRPVEDELRAAVEAGKANLRGELLRVGLPSSAPGLIRSVVRLGSSDSRRTARGRLRNIEIDRVLPRAQLDRALRVLDEAPAPR